jgi:outer membrane protein assembly factor BamA
LICVAQHTIPADGRLRCGAMRGRSLLRLAPLGAWLVAAPFAAAQAPADALSAGTRTREALERAGATIRAVNITVDNVFDPSNPEEDKKLYRWANRVHVRTREDVVEDVLLFAPGDPFVARLLDESARALRARSFIADASVEPGSYDPATNSVDVDVRVRDSWSLALDLKLNRTGGETEWGIGLSDSNLLGTGKTLAMGYSSEIDRDETLLGYADGNVFGSRVRLNAVLAHLSDGDRQELAVERPFYALDTRWALGGSIRDERRIDTIYDLGEEIDEFTHEVDSLSLYGGWSRGLVGAHTQRWLLGITSEQHDFAGTEDVPQPLLVPPERELVYPWLGWQWLEDDFREMTELNDMGRTEDIALGLNVTARVGFAERRFGSDRDATLFSFSAAKGWEPGGPGRLLLIETSASTRREDTGSHDTRIAFSGRYYRRNLERHLFSVSLSALATDDLDPENQVLLGGDNGLRGYPIRYQAGERRTILNVEQRFFTDYYPWRLFRVGYAVFADIGRVGGRDPRASSSRGTLSNVGAGLRLSSPRASGRNVVHIDLAFPVNEDDPTVDEAQFVIETKRSF